MASQSRFKPRRARLILKHRRYRSRNDNKQQRNLKRSQPTGTNNRIPRGLDGTINLEQPLHKEQDYYNAFLDQVEAYKSELRKDLNATVEVTNEKIIETLGTLCDEFDTQCNTIGKAVQPLRKGLASERANIGKKDGASVILTLEKQMADFAKVKDDQYEALVSLWKEYEEVHIELIRCAISIFGEDDTRVVEETLPQNDVQEEEHEQMQQVKEKIQFQHAYEQHLEFEQSFVNASISLDELQGEVGSRTHTVLKDNKALLQTFKTSREKQIDELKSFLENMGML